jgi:hypothetical protein
VDIDLIMGDFDGDGKAEFVGAWPGPDSTVTLYYSGVNESTFQLEGENPMKIQDEGYSKLFKIDEFELKPIIRLELIQRDSDPEPEFVIGYWGDDGDEAGGPIELIVFDNNGTSEPQIVSSIKTERLSPNTDKASTALQRSTKFELAAGDFDGDETQELVMFHVIPVIIYSAWR